MGVRITEKCDMSIGALEAEVSMQNAPKLTFMAAQKYQNMKEKNENFKALLNFPQLNVKILSWCTLAGASQKLCSIQFFQ
jgi:hypothetical protein